MKVYIFQYACRDSDTIISAHKTKEAAETLMGLYMEAEEKAYHEEHWGSVEEVEVLK